ncbi:hypothetical protein LUZ62_027370 [Rhynchospora pubera]|uniref:Uncharacterized protein n=1 Tax=Rhynchospora pubera TaxID=906938 RepID=A0AAV8HAS7_9POAL|nr:hypothetical protein LUZ62_027370 [Rhynchospora pubera]
MAAQQQNQSGSPPTAQLIGNAFVQQYYHILHSSPDLVHRFYQETSKLGRPEANGVMASVTTTDAINDKIMSMEVMKAEIETVDAQESLSGGVIVLVTGHLTGRHDGVRREFTQTFFLAPQEKGYFVLNDLFRYTAASVVVPVTELHDPSAAPHGHVAGEVLANGTAVHYTSEHDAMLHDQHVTEQAVADEGTNKEEVYNPSDNDGSVVEETQIPEVIDEVPENVLTASRDVPVTVSSTMLTSAPAAITTTPSTNDDAPKKSYASIVKVMKENAAAISAPAQVPRSAPVNVPRSAPAPKPEKQVVPAPAPSSVTDAPAFSSNATDSNTVQELEDGHSIYVKNLPVNATPQQLEDEFKKYGAIRPGGIQVRSHKVQGFCYGFVEFEEASAIQSAVEASPVTIDGRQCFVEEKRASSNRGGGRGRFGGRGGSGGASFRNEGPRGGRGGGSYGGSGNRGGYGRSGDFRGGNRGARGGGDYQKVDGSGGPRGARSSAPNVTTSK